MNIEIANRLVELRKKNGYSQEELAEKLGLSRQAVSKWERAESSPDTDNLINLSRLYSISLDALLATTDDIPEPKMEDTSNTATESAPNAESITEDEQTSSHSANKGKDANSFGYSYKYGYSYSYNTDAEKEENGKYNHWKGGMYALIPLLVCAAYVVVGFVWNLWHPGWIMFLSIPVFITLIEGISTGRKKHSLIVGLNIFCFPVLVLIVYLTLGLVLGTWHPYWVLFLTIPMYYTSINLFIKRPNKKKNDNDEQNKKQ